MASTVKRPILVVDDEPEILFSVRSLLRTEFDVHTADGGAKALEELRWHSFHAVLSDQRMPGMTGVEVLARARQDYPEVVRVIVTGYADLKAVIEAVNQGGIFRYLAKPWDPAELTAVVHQACEYYDAITERGRLLEDLRGFVAEGLQRFGDESESWANAGQGLVKRLDRNLKRTAVRTPAADGTLP